MSMLSAQVDELRSMAESVGLAVPQAATLMMEAADTIDRLESENHMLRELVAEMMIALHEYAEKAQSENAKLLDENARFRSCLSDDADNARQIMAENAKLRERIDASHMSRLLTENENESLRELVRELWEGYADPPCEDCPLKDKPACVDCPICAREAAVIDHMRELGVEVDG